MEFVSLSSVESAVHLDFRSRLKNYPFGGWKKISGRFSKPSFQTKFSSEIILSHFSIILLEITTSEPLTEPISYEHTISNVNNVETGLKVGMQIITINEIDICNFKHSELAKLLKKRFFKGCNDSVIQAYFQPFSGTKWYWSAKQIKWISSMVSKEESYLK